MNASGDGEVPPALAVRMRELLAAGDTPAADSAALLAAAIKGLEDFVRQPASAHTALDLLAIDGLVTAAFAAIEDPSRLEDRADDAAARMITLGDRPA